jgi:hypothetical protein
VDQQCQRLRRDEELAASEHLSESATVVLPPSGLVCTGSKAENLGLGPESLNAIGWRTCVCSSQICSERRCSRSSFFASIMLSMQHRQFRGQTIQNNPSEYRRLGCGTWYGRCSLQLKFLCFEVPSHRQLRGWRSTLRGTRRAWLAKQTTSHDLDNEVFRFLIQTAPHLGRILSSKSSLPVLMS